MRSPIGPVLVVLGLATTVVLVLLLFQTIGLRADLDRARDEIVTLQAKADMIEPGVTAVEMQRGLDAVEVAIRDWLIATGADGGFDDDPSTPAGSSPVLDRLDEILERIEDLEARLDEICEGVPIC